MYRCVVTKKRGSLDFIKKYPLDPKAVISTPIVFRAGLTSMKDLVWPSLNGIRDLAWFTGIKDNAIRTALSRSKKVGGVVTHMDESGITRFRISKSYFQMGMASIQLDERKEGFVLAIFSFSKDEISKRTHLRETLKNYGFKMIAQNSYINGNIDTKALINKMKDLNLYQHLYLFHCPDIEDKELVEKIKNVFEIEKRTILLKQFYQDLKQWLSGQNIDTMEIARRILYIGPLHWEICHVNEPPIPNKFKPQNYALDDIKKLYHDYTEKYQQDLIEYYWSVNSK